MSKSKSTEPNKVNWVRIVVWTVVGGFCLAVWWGVGVAVVQIIGRMP